MTAHTFHNPNFPGGGLLPESSAVAKRTAGRLDLARLVFIFFYLLGGTSGNEMPASASSARGAERLVLAGMKWKTLDTHLIPVTFSHLSQDSKPIQTQSPISDQMSCAYLAGDLRAAQRRVDLDGRMVPSISDFDPNRTATDDPNHQLSDLQYDLKLLKHAKAELDKCLAWNERAATKRISTSACPRYQFLGFHVAHVREPIHDIPIWRQGESFAVFFESGLSIDADGAPNTYHPDNIGLDDLANAGEPGFWEGLAVDNDGVPYIQGSGDPFPGYYVSTTDLSDRTKAPSDPARYVDASKIPYIVIPSGLEMLVGARPGDFAVVFNLENSKSSPAIFADTGPPNRIGEGSIALAENLGLWSDARNGGTTRGILYVVFPGSGNGRPRPVEEIKIEGERLFQAWGGNEQLIACGIR